MNNQTALLTTLSRALSTKRPHATKSTDDFTFWLSDHLPSGTDYFFDPIGNLHVDLRHSANNTTLFTAHVDTVHHDEGINRIHKTPQYWTASGDVLGADDGAGVSMLMHLIHNNIPAYYIFTQGEECGGIGAKFIADNYDYLLLQFDRAIAFDRRGLDSVITYQGGLRCCSDAFAYSLSNAISADDLDMMHSPDDTGVYTDTKEFIYTIPECTNISIGYYSEHTQAEKLDLSYFFKLSAALIRIDWDALPTVRDTSITDNKWTNWDSYGSTSPYYAPSLDYYYDKTLENLYDALLLADQGFPSELEIMIAETVYPDDPHMARQHIRQKYITPEMIDDALNKLDYLDAESILFDLFDAAYAA